MKTSGPSEWYAEARRRARAYRRRKVAEEASTEWPEFAPPVGRADGLLGEIQDCDREIARLTAVRARKVAEFAASRPASADRAQGEPGAMSAQRWAARPELLRPVSEWAGQELSVALSLSSQAADGLLEQSLTLAHRLPGTLAALEAAALHPGHLWAMLDKVAPIEDATIRAEVEAELLRWVHGRVKAPPQLAERARTVVLRRDARAAARNLEKAIRERGVHLRPDRVDGMAAVTLLLTTPEARAFVQALGKCADSLEDDPDAPPRTRGQKMADCAMDLVLRPGETDLPLVQILLHVVASIGTLAGGDEPGEIDGTVVPAEMIRQLVQAFGPQPPADPTPAAADVPAEPAAERSDGAEPHSAPEPAPAPGWGQREQEEIERCLAEIERQILSGEWGVGPDYGLEPWNPVPPDGELADDPVSDVEILARQLAHPAAVDPGYLDDDPFDEPPLDLQQSVPQMAMPAAGGWWSTADRAVDDASTAVLEAQRALAQADRAVHAATRADDADEADWRNGPDGRVTAAQDALGALASATAAQRAWLAELFATTGGGGLVERPRILLTDATTGALIALTDLPAMRRAGTCGRTTCRRRAERCDHDLTGRPGLGPPGPSDGYRPSVPLDRWVRARDRRCRFPGCRRRVPRGGELDHNRPHPHGPTSATNLAGYCTTHHRGKHQAPGWRHHLAPDGTLTVTTPTGLTAVTTPPPY